MNTVENGFTIIELVVVVTILGILAAFAFPRFAALEVEARAATVNGLAGSVRSAASLAHSLAIVTDAGPTGPVTLDGQTIVLVEFYPDLASADNTVWDLSGFSYAPGTGLFTKDGATTPANCSVDYDEAPPNGAPAITVDTSGC